MLSWVVAPLMLLATVPAPNDGHGIELVESGLSSPVFVTAPEGDERLFVVERGGNIKILIDDAVLPNRYVDVGPLLPASPGSEQGLLGMAFHPNFESNGKIYLAYTDSGGDLVVGEIITDPSSNTASITSIKTVIEIDQPYSNHNGGMILFGPDNFLYIGSGDGGSGGDPQGNGQNTDTLLGAILRINVDNDAFPADPNRNYSIPADNPFVGAAGADEIWIYGLRNPWRFWIDEPTGRLYIGDVGQSSREEISVLEPGSGGSNLGWDILEGTVCYPPGASCSSAGTVLPKVEYTHGAGSASVTGGVVYRGSDAPNYFGHYFYADFVNGWVRSFRYDGSVSSHFDWSSVLNTNLVSSFGVDGKGEMYIVSLSGSIWRFVGPPKDDEMFFYRDDGLFRYYNVRSDGTLPSPILQGDGYTTGWDSIVGVDLEGDGRDEMFFYRQDGLYRYYDVRSDGTLPQPLLAGDDYTTGWDSITAIDLDGDGQDEMFFYRQDGLFRFYDIAPDGSLGTPILEGDGYTTGWSSIASIDLDGDGQDEMFFYRDDGLFRYYHVNPDGALPAALLEGDGYTSGWESITSIDLEGDGQDEMFFYRDDGLFRYYQIRPDGTLPSPILQGDKYTSGWSAITALNID